MRNRWVPLDKKLVNYLPKDRPYTRLEAMFCHQVDIDNENYFSINGYSKLWQWSRNKVRRFLGNIKRTGEGQAKDTQGTRDGQDERLIILDLQKPKDTQRTGEGQAKDRGRTPTKKTKNKDLSLFFKGVNIKDLYLSLNKKIHTRRLCIETNGQLVKLKSRLKNFKKEEIILAADNMLADPFMNGDNNSNKKYASLEYLIRNDENIRKWLEKAPGKVSRLMKVFNNNDLED